MSTPAPSPRGRLLRLGAAAVAALAVWGVLVVVAVRQVGHATDGDASAWWWAALSTAGAAAALLVALLTVVRLREAPAPPRPRGGKRAAR